MLHSMFHLLSTSLPVHLLSAFMLATLLAMYNELFPQDLITHLPSRFDRGTPIHLSLILNASIVVTMLRIPVLADAVKF